MLRIIGILMFLFLGMSLARANDGNARTIMYDGLERLLWVVDGRKDKSNSVPLVVALHGYRKPEEAVEIQKNPSGLGWDRLVELALEEGFIAVFPAAFRGQWNLFPGLKNVQKEDGAEINDEAFLLHLIEGYVTEGAADPAQVYLTGISDGAIMTHRMACLPNTPFAAVAGLIGAAHEIHISDCNPEKPPALLQIHGDNDQVLPYEGWIFRTGREVSVAEVMDHWRRLHGCTGQSAKRLEDIDKEDGSSVIQFDWTGCKADPNVRLYKIKGGGHDVPALDADRREPSKQQINRDIDAIGEVWRFFSSAQKRID